MHLMYWLDMSSTRPIRSVPSRQNFVLYKTLFIKSNYIMRGSINKRFFVFFRITAKEIAN